MNPFPDPGRQRNPIVRAVENLSLNQALGLGAGVAARGVAGLVGDAVSVAKAAYSGTKRIFASAFESEDLGESPMVSKYKKARMAARRRASVVGMPRRGPTAYRRTSMPYRGAIRRGTFDMNHKPEMFYKDVSGAITPSYTPTDTGSLLNGIAVGTGDNARRGSKVNPIKLNLHLHIRHDAPSAAHKFSSSYRIIVVYDRQSNGSQCTVADLFTVPAGIAGDYINAFRNLENKDRFYFLFDKVYKLGPAGSYSADAGAYASPVEILLRRSIRIPGPLITQYKTQTSDHTAIQTGAMWIFVMGYPNAASALASCHCVTRLRYYDI